jgi:hypothetical protein
MLRLVASVLILICELIVTLGVWGGGGAKGLLGGMMYSAISYISMMKAAAAQKRDSTN